MPLGRIEFAIISVSFDTKVTKWVERVDLGYLWGGQCVH